MNTTIKGAGPDFVCIGAQKAGTTWLYDNLVDQRDVWVPPEKEIHFFNTVCPHEELLGVEERLPPSGWRRYEALKREPSLRTIRWLRNFYYAPASIPWYYSLFPPETIGSKKAGDITPAYSTLDQRGVDFARRVLKPGCRIVFLVRNPIDRVWSAIKMLYRWKGDTLPSEELDAMLALASHPSHRLRGEYTRIIRLWGGAFGDDFRVFRYEQLAANPRELLREVGEFIGVNVETSHLDLAKRSNYDPDRKPMPERLRQALTKTYRREIEELDALLPGVAEDWLPASVVASRS